VIELKLRTLNNFRYVVTTTSDYTVTFYLSVIIFDLNFFDISSQNYHIMCFDCGGHPQATQLI
jgi:hypothetical protein